MNGKSRGFTLIELLVVVGMIAIILGAMSTSMSAAQNRARIQKATSDVKVITQAILAYENYRELPTMENANADKGSLGFLIGQGGGASEMSGNSIPVLLMAALRGGGQMLDPWGVPYTVTIRKNTGSVKISTATGNMQSGYFLPNFYRVSQEERALWTEQ